MRAIDDPRLCKLVTFSPPAVVTFIFLSVSRRDQRRHIREVDIGGSQYRHVRPTVKLVLTGNVTSFIQQAEESPGLVPRQQLWFIDFYWLFFGTRDARNDLGLFLVCNAQSYIPRSLPTKIIKTIRIKRN